jgi:AhpD family alkylhydroperoxidase
MAVATAPAPGSTGCLVPFGSIPADLAAGVTAKMGTIPPGNEFFVEVPWLFRHACFSRAIPNRLPGGLADLVGFVVSQDNSCRYCYGAQRAMLRFMGYKEGQIDRIEKDVQASEISPKDQTALDFARRLSRSNPRPAKGELAALEKAGFSRDDIVGIAMVAAGFCGHNRLATMLQIPPFEPLEAASRNPIKKFFFMRGMKAMMAKQVEPTFEKLPPDVKLPAASVLAATSETPAGRERANAIKEMWESDGLPKRAKALVFAVVARALDCKRTQDDAVTLLRGEGMTDAEIDEVLETLDGESLTDLEREVVAFARDSVRYQADSIIQRTRELARGKAPKLLLEIVGVVAFANCETRLGALLEVD